MKKQTILLWWIGCCMICSNSLPLQAETPASNEKTAKYIFYFIGDGMSMPQIYLAESALKAKGFDSVYQKRTERKLESKELRFKTFPSFGMATTNAENRYITGSAAAATALATGHKTTINTLGMNGDRSSELKNISEMAHKKGMKVGILTSVSMDHATPAGFYAHVPNRNNTVDIDSQMIQTGFDYFAGGTIRYDSHKKSNYADWKVAAKNKGYTYVTNKAEFNALNKKSGKVIATLSMFDSAMVWSGSLPYNIDLHQLQKIDDKISLAEFTQKGIELLDNPKGFFMMIEGGKIDWCGHANDAASSVYEIIAFNEAVEKAFDFYRKHPSETLIVITGDHETGGLTMGFAGTHYESAFEKLMHQTCSYEFFTDEESSWKNRQISFEQALEIVKEYFGLGDEKKGLALSPYEIKQLKNAFDKRMGKPLPLTKEEVYLAYGDYSPVTVTVTHILANKAGINWGSYSHTSLPVPVFAIGCGSKHFDGYYDNTDIARRVMQVGQLK